MKHIKKAILLIVLSAIHFGSIAFDLTKINLSYHYQMEADILLNNRVVSDGDLWNVYVEVRAASIARWSKVLLLQNSYNAIDHDTLSTFSVDTFLIEEDKQVLKYIFPKKSLGKVLIFCYSDLDKGTYRFFDISLNPMAVYSSFCPLDRDGMPIIRSYVSQSSVIFPNDGKYHVYSYPENFGPADPPMGEIKALAPTLDIDSSFFVHDSLQFSNRKRFYLIQKDTTVASGTTLLDVPYYFPETRLIDELVPPLTYITTSAEFSVLTAVGDQKKNFESFWVKTYGTRFRAKRAIKNFYDRIKEANLLFTSYKMGWKSDRGVIYIIYGAPDSVLKDERSEIWKYPEVQYEFVKISTLFAPQTYSLKRNKRYEKEWYRQIRNLREGDG
ncbi:MAG: GWxTD domain-containing protein [Cyclobacteriaceae bacterium]|jgi:GWxTD domain-containing protein